MDSVIIMSSVILFSIIGMVLGHYKGSNSTNHYGDYRGVGARILWFILGFLSGGIIGLTLGALVVHIPIVVAILVAVIGFFFSLELLNKKVRDRNYRIFHNMTSK